ncbi:hypothetical protein LTR99_003041 [Exophiala xenobiotica]|uniref:ubiquitinyl hydrolase 1 n=1 Tax=Vermiconidia calcicola TaxID=1690605 RepID=A0AAV9QC46_9PEZI|nr:hypothetical protein LTR92_005782 [Exophiala xenobiotica]KAK5538709.1 hypothetical protein LTR25_004252 [Vermiconidia calcicola]KAK5547802.1 hypothetical protein LTR23_002050 [Chaetothyriales sp. CCFEE 6169]KAK5212752.1 hypothetical protein LTR41_001699 [Exophiala xenobiotica]KAK5221932.1 hypothetical protein LTR72_006188 [Exophiala xenobiotica]
MPMRWNNSNGYPTNTKPIYQQGPLVGEKRPLSDLVTEYAQADQTYVLKTTALAVTHTAYRSIKGDGQCGWRGVVFGYFELLIRSGDLGLITQEKVRLLSFEQTMRAVGIDYDIIIDMFDYTWELFDAIKTAVGRGDMSDTVLLEAMNDQGRSDSIVYHFKMMTSSFMQLQADRYAPFMDMSVTQYCLTRIDPANQEIEHIGLQALNDAVIAPAYIALEVLYLDRSAGDEVTPHRFVDDAHHWPTLRLIYRPGHYDIIYKDNKPIQVLLQAEPPQYVLPFRDDGFRSNMESAEMHSFMFPTANMVASQPLSNTSPATSINPYPMSFPQPQPMVPEDTTLLAQAPYFPPARVSGSQRQRSYQPPAHPIRSLSLPDRSCSSSMVPSHSETSLSSLPCPSPSPLTPYPMGSVSEPHEYQIRYHGACYQYKLQGQQSLPLDPGSFGSSAQNAAHFAHAEFQPSIWNAKEEYGKRDGKSPATDGGAGHSNLNRHNTG